MSDVLYIHEVTYSGAQTLVSSSDLEPGSFYKITDRGDQGILLQALSENEFSPVGIRYMLCPATYQQTTYGSFYWLGIWNPQLTPSSGHRVIWGGQVWINVTGNPGSAVSPTNLDVINWVLVSKSSFSNNEYVPRKFGVVYDFANDWISKQWDENGNYFGVDYLSNQNDLNYPFNPCDISDWNIPSASPVLLLLRNNKVTGVWNNAGLQACSNNSNAGEISANKLCAVINNNSNAGKIFGNGDGNVEMNIQENSNNGDISGNTGGGLIRGNSNNGGIVDNIVSSSIDFNSNKGDIFQNQCGAGIEKNSNGGSINLNTNNGGINNNSNGGNIGLNTPATSTISFNTCPRNIVNDDFTGGLISVRTTLYRQYVARLMQAATGDPVAFVEPSNSVGNLSWTRTAKGKYEAALPGAFPSSNPERVWVSGISLCNDDYTGLVGNFSVKNEDTLVFTFHNAADGSMEDLHGTACFEIRIYPY